MRAVEACAAGQPCISLSPGRVFEPGQWARAPVAAISPSNVGSRSTWHGKSLMRAGPQRGIIIVLWKQGWQLGPFGVIVTTNRTAR